MNIKHVEIQGTCGKLAAILQIPSYKKDEKIPLVIMMHGLKGNKDSELLVNLSQKLIANGVATIRFDFDGCGQSEGEFINMTVPKELDDAHKVYEYASTLDFVSSICLMGHSLGGVVASMLAGELGDNKIKCLVLMAAAASLKDDALKGNIQGVGFDPKNIPDFISLGDLKVGHDYLATLQTLPIYETASKYDGPVCILQGRDDQVVNTEYAIKYQGGYKLSELHLLNHEVHMFSYNMNQATDIAERFIINQLFPKRH